MSEGLPKHIAIIMDGNGRWATQRGLPRYRGHEAGADSVRDVVETSGKLGIETLTLYSFSTENWNRPADEVEALMLLLKHYLTNEASDLMENNVRLRAIGELYQLDTQLRELINEVMILTKDNDGLELVLAVAYGGRSELVHAVSDIAQRASSGTLDPTDIDEGVISDALYTGGIPDPDFLIRTSGEQRISNFLLWQLAYTELYFSPVLWPDFRKDEFMNAINEYQRRHRRYGNADASGEETPC